ncbi:MAG TPA: beta-ketoacyl-ACP synthase II [Spirochaetia bacterium]|nr:beta-ketoacyl-ACP synthase II [Spirochaetia bacterium]
MTGHTTEYRRPAGDRRVVITGLGTINPTGNTVAEFWTNLEAGKSGVRRSKNVDLGDFSVQISAEVDLPENVAEYFSSKKMFRRLDRFVILATVAGLQAVKDSGLDIDKAPFRYGTIIGSGAGGLGAHTDNIPRMLQNGLSNGSPFYIVNAIPNTGSAYLSQEAGLMGPSFSVNSACATGNHAIGVAAMMIRSGMADAMFAGGSEAVATQIGIGAFGNILALSTRNDSPETASRPFDRDRNGFVLGEGASVLCLEDLEHAVKRGARIYAELTGFSFTGDAYDLVAPHPEAAGAAECIQSALADARVSHDKLDLINCHGTSTQMGDRIESIAINRALGVYAQTVLAHSTKSMIGHLLGGASSTEALAAILAIDGGIVHASLNVFNQDPDVKLNVVKETMKTDKIRNVLSNAFGFGGHNAAIVLSRFEK